ncbi:MAG: hypothetical protein AAFX01_02255 [Cyanobacteria bacterium J06638_28]
MNMSSRKPPDDIFPQLKNYIIPRLKHRVIPKLRDDVLPRFRHDIAPQLDSHLTLKSRDYIILIIFSATLVYGFHRGLAPFILISIILIGSVLYQSCAQTILASVMSFIASFVEAAIAGNTFRKQTKLLGNQALRPDIKYLVSSFSPTQIGLLISIYYANKHQNLFTVRSGQTALKLKLSSLRDHGLIKPYRAVAKQLQETALFYTLWLLDATRATTLKSITFRLWLLGTASFLTKIGTEMSHDIYLLEKEITDAFESGLTDATEVRITDAGREFVEALTQLSTSSDNT